MSNQRGTVIGAIEYSLATLKNLKSDLQDLSANNKELNWAIGGIVATLNSNLLQTCNQVFHESAAEGKPDARQDLLEIKERFSAFIDRMVNHE